MLATTRRWHERNKQRTSSQPPAIRVGLSLPECARRLADRDSVVELLAHAEREQQLEEGEDRSQDQALKERLSQRRATLLEKEVA